MTEKHAALEDLIACLDDVRGAVDEAVEHLHEGGALDEARDAIKELSDLCGDCRSAFATYLRVQEK